MANGGREDVHVRFKYKIAEPLYSKLNMGGMGGLGMPLSVCYA